MARLIYGESSSAANPVLDLYIRDGNDAPIDPVALEFAIFDFTAGVEAQVHPATGRQAVVVADVPTGQRLSTGRFFAPWTVLTGANVGTYRLRWWSVDANAVSHVFTEEFEVLAVASPAVVVAGFRAVDLAVQGLDIQATESATRIRRTGGWATGVYSETARALTDFACSCTQAEGRDIKLLPEGKRSSGALRFITRQQLRTADKNNQLADLITFDGTDYEVGHAEPWPPGSGSAFTKAIATRVGA